MVRLALIAVALGGCVKDAYRCSTDADCNLGEAGRCEADRHCTAYDATCASGRRYTEHSEARTGVCFDDRVVPANLCAEGQPPALPEGCLAEVCTALPACCTTGWSNACVQQAQLHCDVGCETRIAITATKGMTTELWDLRWTGTAWTAVQPAGRQGLLAWVAPAPNTVEPRLVSFDRANAAVLLDDQVIAVSSRAYQDVAVIDLDRAGRDTLVLSSNNEVAPLQHFVEVVDLASGDVREIAMTASNRLVWGDSDHDAFPDAVVASGTRYVLVSNEEAVDRRRTVAEVASSNVSGINTPGSGAAQVRAIEWADANGDGILDVVVSGNSFRVHLGSDRIRDVPVDINYDCDPPAPPASNCLPETSGFAHAVRPQPTGASILLALYPRRALYEATLQPNVNRMDLTPLTLPACVGCAPIVALVTRDLDGDRVLDVIAIDADLEVLTRLSTGGGAFTQSTPIATTVNDFTTVRVSVTGALP